MKMRTILIALVLLLLVAAAPRAGAQEYLIKFATVAPEGSTPLKFMREFDQAVRAESKGRLGFKIYPGMVQGDEKDVLRKIKLGQLHGAGITGVGMTSIAPRARILDSPFLFRSYAEVDYITRLLDQELKENFEEGGFVNLGWAEVGWTYVYTNTPVRVPEDMRKVKMWMWEGDPIAEAAFKALDINPIPLSLADVNTSLQTNLIDGVYAPALELVALQWFSHVKYMLDAPLADAAGAVVIQKKKFDSLPPELQEILRRNGQKYMQKLTEATRTDNAKAVETLKKNGIQVIEPPPEDTKLYEAVGKKARQLLVGRLYPQELLTKVEQALDSFRQTAGKPRR